MKKKIMIVSLILATVLVIISLGVSFGVSSSYRDLLNNYEGYFQYHSATITALLEKSKNKTVKNDLEKTLPYYELYHSFGLIGNIAIGQTSARIYSNNVPPCFGIRVMTTDPNNFLKENQFGDLYTVFKTDKGTFIYCILSVERYQKDGEVYEDINFSKAYWVFEKVLSKDVFDTIVIGKTTRREVFDLTNEWKMFDECTHMYTNMYHMTLEECLASCSEEFYERNSALYKLPSGSLYLTSEGVFSVSFEFDETLGEHVVSAMEFTEGCPINPEDLI